MHGDVTDGFLSGAAVGVDRPTSKQLKRRRQAI